MIKDLISDLAYDKINLSQALNRSKLIAYKTHNSNFEIWLRKELAGYDYDDEFLPAHRIIDCQVFITHALPNGQKHSKPVMVVDGAKSEFYKEINYVRILQPISIIEQQISELKDVGYIHLTTEDAINISQGDKYQKWVVGGFRRIGKVQFQNIIELTKQKLIDTLIELEDEFPNLINDYNMSKENNDEVQNIITNHIYGNNNSTNVAAGVSVNQNLVHNYLTDEDWAKLKTLGISEIQIEELKKIVETSCNDKLTFVGKTMKWLGSVSASVAGRGLYENIPATTDFIHKMTL